MLTDKQRNSLDDALVDSGCHGFQGDHPPLYEAAEQIIQEQIKATIAPDGIDGHQCIRVEAYMEVIAESNRARSAIHRVLTWCDKQDGYSKGESPTTATIRRLLNG